MAHKLWATRRNACTDRTLPNGNALSFGKPGIFFLQAPPPGCTWTEVNQDVLHTVGMHLISHKFWLSMMHQHDHGASKTIQVTLWYRLYEALETHPPGRNCLCPTWRSRQRISSWRPVWPQNVCSEECVLVCYSMGPMRKPASTSARVCVHTDCNISSSISMALI